MKTKLWVAIAAGFSICAFGQASVRTRVEATFGAPGQDSGHVLQWRISELEDGSLLIDVLPLSVPAHGVQGRTQFHISRSFELLGYTLEASSDDPMNTFHFKFSCAVGKVIQCDSLTKGAPGHWEIAKPGPFMIIPSEDFGGDVFWGYAIALHSAKKRPGEDIKVAIVGMDIDEEVPHLKILETEVFKYVGQEEIQTAVGKMRADTFSSKDSTIWLAPSGFPIAYYEGGPQKPSLELKTIRPVDNVFVPSPGH